MLTARGLGQKTKPGGGKSVGDANEVQVADGNGKFNAGKNVFASNSLLQVARENLLQSILIRGTGIIESVLQKLTLKGSNGTSGAGSAGYDVEVLGGNGNGSGNHKGGDVIISGGDPSNSGGRGTVKLQRKIAIYEINSISIAGGEAQINFDNEAQRLVDITVDADCNLVFINSDFWAVAGGRLVVIGATRTITFPSDTYSDPFNTFYDRATQELDLPVGEYEFSILRLAADRFMLKVTEIDL